MITTNYMWNINKYVNATVGKIVGKLSRNCKG